MFVLELSDDEAMNLLNVLERCSEFPLSLTFVRRRLLELSQRSTVPPIQPITEQLDPYAETLHDTPNIRCEYYKLILFSLLEDGDIRGRAWHFIGASSRLADPLGGYHRMTQRRSRGVR